MTARRRNRSHALTQQATEMAMAVPHVVAHRVTRMALAGPVLSERDRTEFELMSAEKTSAMVESIQAMAAETLRAQQNFTLAMVRAMWSPLFTGRGSASAFAGSVGSRMNNAAMDVIGKGMEPLHRTAVANAKRLRKTSFR